MKKYLLFLFLLFLLSIFFKVNATVFCEMATLTGCHACPSASENLYEIYSSHEYPFYFVSLVADKDDEAEERIANYNVNIYPTTFFDGGYEIKYGKKNKEEYIKAIEKCMEREKPDIEIRLSSKIVENEIRVNVRVKNNENGKYEGYIKVYVVEPKSRWKYYNKKEIHFGFLGFAMNKAISINGKDEIEENAVWSKYEIKSDNIIIFAAIFNKENFVDAFATSIPTVDSPPLLHLITKPSKIHGYRNVTFKWNATDDFTPSYAILFSYKLDGYEDWHEWSNKNSITYENLEDGEYNFIVRARDNKQQISQIEWKFRIDTSKPRVVEYYPKNRKISPTTPLYIKFSHRMSKDIKIEIFPPTHFSYEWKNDYIIYIYPMLDYTTKYEVSIYAKRISGQSINFSFSFETSPQDIYKPYVLYALPNGEELFDKIKIKFSEPMDKIIHKGIIIEPSISYSYEWKENDTLLIISLKKFVIGRYNLTITEYMQDKHENKLMKDYSIEFYISKPSIVYTSIENGDTILSNMPIEIKFSHEMNKEDVERKIHIEPKCNYTLQWKNKTLIIKADFERNRKYYINISNAKDIRNLSMNNFSIYFIVQGEIEREKESPSFTMLFTIVAILLLLLRNFLHCNKL